MDDAVLAVQRVIVATFDRAKWMELGYRTGTADRIRRDPRLLRSLDWDDDDYGGRVFDVLPEILGSRLERLADVERFTDAEDWLRDNDRELYARVYDDGPQLEDLERSSDALGVPELRRHAARIRAAVHDDPEQAVGSAKELVETVLRHVLGLHGDAGRHDLPDLLKRAQRKLRLDPQATSEADPVGKLSKRTLSNLGQLVTGIGELRNLRGTGHGRSRVGSIDRAHARLAVDSALAVATYFIDVAAQDEAKGDSRRSSSRG